MTTSIPAALLPMVRNEAHLERILVEIGQFPGLVLFTLVNPVIRATLEDRCPRDGAARGRAARWGQRRAVGVARAGGKARPGRQHTLDAAYFARVEAIQWTIAHDDGIASDDWEEAEIVLAGVSRSSKTPTSIYLANRGYKTANIPIIVESPPPAILYKLQNPLVVGLTTSADGWSRSARNRLLSLKPENRDRLCRAGRGDEGGGLCPPAVRRQWLAGDRRDALGRSRKPRRRSSGWSTIATCRRWRREARPRVGQRVAPGDVGERGRRVHNRQAKHRRGCRQGVARRGGHVGARYRRCTGPTESAEGVGARSASAGAGIGFGGRAR